MYMRACTYHVYVYFKTTRHKVEAFIKIFLDNQKTLDK